MNPKLFWVVILLFLFSCTEENVPNTNSKFFIKGADCSALPEIATENCKFYNEQGLNLDAITILKRNGCNTIRLRLWHTPSSKHCDLKEVSAFAKTIKAMGLKVWITVHYSDWWADPGQQQIPAAWQNLNYLTLKDSVAQYTQLIINTIHPDYIQIGNEINSGLLWPMAHIYNEQQFLGILDTASKVIRKSDPNCKIILHYAGYENAAGFFQKVRPISYDIMGISYYPKWHGKNIGILNSSLNNLAANFQKDILLAEVAYPFTLGYNDWTNNIFGSDSDLILPAYPATALGQKDFLFKMKEVISSIPKGIGFCYWGAELVAFKGPQSTTGSPWENAALFDFNQTALPAQSVFNQ